MCTVEVWHFRIILNSLFTSFIFISFVTIAEVLKATYHGRQVAVKIYKKTASKLAITYEASLMT